jgi:Rod binding domain-containing protein
MNQVKKSQGEKIFEGMLDEEWGKKLANQNTHNSLGELLYRQMSRNLGLEDEKIPARDEKGFMELTGTDSSTIALPQRESYYGPEANQFAAFATAPE